MNAFFKASAIAAATATLATGLAVAPASAATFSHSTYAAPGEYSADYGRHRYTREDYRRGYGNRDDYRYRDGYRDNYRDARVWRGDNGRYYCRKKDGTTGLLIGGAAGALLGREVDGGRDRTLGTVIGAAAGALLGREVDRGSSCR